MGFLFKSATISAKFEPGKRCLWKSLIHKPTTDNYSREQLISLQTVAKLLPVFNTTLNFRLIAAEHVITNRVFYYIVDKHILALDRLPLRQSPPKPWDSESKRKSQSDSLECGCSSSILTELNHDEMCIAKSSIYSCSARFGALRLVRIHSLHVLPARIQFALLMPCLTTNDELW